MNTTPPPSTEDSKEKIVAEMRRWIGTTPNTYLDKDLKDWIKRLCALPAPGAQADAERGVRAWLAKYTPTDDFGCACTPQRTCGTCQWRERTAELRAMTGVSG